MTAEHEAGWAAATPVGDGRGGCGMPGGSAGRQGPFQRAALTVGVTVVVVAAVLVIVAAVWLAGQ